MTHHVATENLLTPEQMARVRDRLSGLRAQGLSQVALASKFAISQSLVSRILSPDYPHTITHGVAARMADAAGMSVDELVLGSAGAGRWESEDPITMRGRALDVLAAVYDDDFLRSVRDRRPPTGSDAWELEQWVDWIVSIRRVDAGPPPSRHRASNRPRG